MVRRSLASQTSPYQGYAGDSRAILALGQEAAPWLTRILYAPQSQNAAEAQIRSNAAGILGDLRRWEDLLKALDSESWSASYAAEGALTALLLNPGMGDVTPLLPRIERIAASSPRVHARTSAMGVLSSTRDPKYVVVCSANLAYDSSDLSRAVPGAWAGHAGLRAALDRFHRICVHEPDLQVRIHAARCLVGLDDPRPLPLLLEVARH